MAKKRAAEADDDLLNELDELEEEELVDEVDEEPEAEEFDEDPDAKPTKSKRSRAKKAGGTKRAAKEGVGTNEVADEAGIDSRKLRMVLRAMAENGEIDKPEDGWRWSSLSHPDVKKILKRIKGGAVKEEQSKRLDKVKGKKASAKKTSKKGRKKASADE